MKLLISTKNKNKIKEIKEYLKDMSGFEILSLDDIDNPPDVIENGNTFEENAIKKARQLADFCGLTVMADDSGLEIDALGGEPGVLSARYAGDNSSDTQRNELVLRKMQNVPDAQRTARFVCAIAIAHRSVIYIDNGICEGIITREMKGEGGFGYDPIFYLPEYNKTMAELDLQQKNKISHRAKALEKSLVTLKNILELQNKIKVQH